MLLVIIATIVCDKSAPTLSARTTNAGRRFAVRKFESGNNTKTTSPWRQFIVGIHFWPIPILGERPEPSPKIGRFVLIDPFFAKIDPLSVRDQSHDDQRTLGSLQRLEQLHFPIAVDTFDRPHHR
jgi:hypothetical protein